MIANSPLPHLGGLTPTEFLRDYWQKKPLLVRNAFPELAYRLSPEDLMELAQEESVEARLILEKGKTPWELRSGPFTAKQFKQLPKTHWTLLVQAVDHYLPELADYLDHFNFIPNWRIDDIMMSFAPEGGSVGPHYDQYDVFLVQGIGRRRWQLGQHCDDTTPRVQGTALRIIENIDTHFDEELHPGDLLYVPPGLAHYGVAQNDCTTYSFGFRAPALTELLERVADTVLEQEGRVLASDAGRSPCAQPGLLTIDDIEQLRAQMLTLLNDRAQFAQALAPLLSEPKYSDYEPQGDELSPDEILAALANGALLRRDPASRCLYTNTDTSTDTSPNTNGEPDTLYINGMTEDFPPRLAALVRLLADHRHLTAEQLAGWQDDAEAISWLQAQIALGHWFLDAD
ncbi:MAG: cupin domain-containing protein [Moraxellaceae bacterium]|nr:cupin domain-containing protein [Moraxellaceae bacterium]